MDWLCNKEKLLVVSVQYYMHIICNNVYKMKTYQHYQVHMIEEEGCRIHVHDHEQQVC